jgi:signal transduction histidine kinase
VLEDLLPLAAAKQIDLGIEQVAELTVQADETGLFTLLRNLVDNAVRYTPEGGRVDLSLDETPEAICLTVEDNGPGIAPAERERVMDAFYRVLGSDTAGSGLGLSIVKAVADRLGASVVLTDSSRYPSGLKVCVYLPRRAQG